MRVTHTMLADKFNYNLQRNLQGMEKYSNKLSTGKEFTRPTQDPIGTGKTMRFSNSLDRNEQYIDNMSESRGWLETTEAALSESNDVVNRVRELAVYGANDSLKAEDRDALADEVGELYEHLIGQANAEYNQLYLFGGHQTQEEPFQEVNAYNVEMEEEAEQIHVVDDETYLEAAALGEEVTLEFVEGEELGVELVDDNTVQVTLNEEEGNTYAEIASAVREHEDASEMLEVSVHGDPATTITETEELENDNGEFTLEAPLFAEEPTAGGLQDGSYELTVEDAGDSEASIEVEQEALQSADGIFGGAEPGEVTDGDEYNASIILEVEDTGGGEAEFSYRGHVYHADSGEYQYVEGEVTLDDDDNEITLALENGDNLTFELDDDFNSQDLQAGDRAVLNLQAASDEGDFALDLNGDFEEGEANTRFNFSQDALEDELDTNFFTLDENPDSEDFGRVFDGNLELNFNQVREQDPAVTFDYDEDGVLEYRGDNGHRDQAISPYQEVTMNINGEEAFGEDAWVLEAVRDTYHSLRNNDREALGNENLGELDRAVDHLLGRVSEVGARANRMEAMENTLEDENVLLREMRSDVEDIDIAETITEFTMRETAYHAALHTTARIMQPTLVDYLQ